MLKDLVNGDTLHSIFSQQLGDQVLARGRDISPNRVIECDFLIYGLATNLFVILAVEWQVFP